MVSLPPIWLKSEGDNYPARGGSPQNTLASKGLRHLLMLSNRLYWIFAVRGAVNWWGTSRAVWRQAAAAVATAGYRIAYSKTFFGPCTELMGTRMAGRGFCRLGLIRPNLELHSLTASGSTSDQVRDTKNRLPVDSRHAVRAGWELLCELKRVRIAELEHALKRTPVDRGGGEPGRPGPIFSVFRL